MIEVLEGLPDGVVGIEAVGEVTAHDYETVLIPLFDAARAQEEHVRALFVAGAFAGLIPSGLRAFPLSQRADAEAWVAG